MKLEGRVASASDAAPLAAMNQRLIEDEGHRNPMSLGQLTQRMTAWLEGEYQAILFSTENKTVGYALFKEDPDSIYLRQLYVEREFRRNGIGTATINWLKTNTWQDNKRVRLDVLVKNTRGIAFWRSVGFKDYCITMEL